MDPDSKLSRFGPVVLVRASGHFGTAEMASVLRYVTQARREAKEPLYYIALLPVGAEPPSAATREAMNRATDVLLTHCHSMAVVIQGSSTKSALMRSVLRGMLLVRGLRSRIRIVSTIQEALDGCALAPQIRAQVLAEATSSDTARAGGAR